MATDRSAGGGMGLSVPPRKRRSGPRRPSPGPPPPMPRREMPAEPRMAAVSAASASCGRTSSHGIWRMSTPSRLRRGLWQASAAPSRSPIMQSRSTPQRSPVALPLQPPPQSHMALATAAVQRQRTRQRPRSGHAHSKFGWVRRTGLEAEWGCYGWFGLGCRVRACMDSPSATYRFYPHPPTDSHFRIFAFSLLQPSNFYSLPG